MSKSKKIIITLYLYLKKICGKNLTPSERSFVLFLSSSFFQNPAEEEFDNRGCKDDVQVPTRNEIEEAPVISTLGVNRAL